MKRPAIAKSWGPYRYLDAGGGDPKTPLRYEIIFEQARATAWIALAVSYSGKPGIAIW
jgi:hypothetical protein